MRIKDIAFFSLFSVSGHFLCFTDTAGMFRMKMLYREIILDVLLCLGRFPLNSFFRGKFLIKKLD